MRDFISASAIFRNSGQRSDTIFSMRLDEFQNGVWKKDFWVVLVKDHKTVHSHGAAAVPLAREVHDLMRVWIEYIRPVLIWRESGEGRMPAGLLHKPLEQLRWKLDHPVEVRPEDMVFVTSNNKPVGRRVES